MHRSQGAYPAKAFFEATRRGTFPSTLGTAAKGCPQGYAFARHSQKTGKRYSDRAAGGRVKGGKARPSRSIKQIFEQSSKIWPPRVEKIFSTRGGGKDRPSRSIKQIFELFKVQKSGLSGAKRLFRPAEAPGLCKRFGSLWLLFCRKKDMICRASQMEKSVGGESGFYA